MCEHGPLGPPDPGLWVLCVLLVLGALFVVGVILGCVVWLLTGHQVV